MKYLILLTACLLSCSNSNEGNNIHQTPVFNTPDTKSVIILEDTVDSDTKKQKTDVFGPKDTSDPLKTDQIGTKSDILDKKDSKSSEKDTISSDIAENDAKTDTKPKFRVINLELKKSAAIVYLTEKPS